MDNDEDDPWRASSQRSSIDAIIEVGKKDVDRTLIRTTRDVDVVYDRAPENLRRLARPDELHRDIREERFVVHTLQIAIQEALDVASHLVSDARLGEPRTNRELFELLERGGVITAPLASTLRNMVGFRNVIVHGYDTVDLAIVRDVLEHRLDDLLAFAASVRMRL